MSLDLFNKATENMQAVLEDDEQPTSTETTVDLEVKVAEEVTEPEDEAEEAIEEVEETTEATDQMLEAFDRLEHDMGVIAKYGLSQPVRMLIDPAGDQLQRYAPGIPALENLDVVGSVSSNETIMALEGFKEAMKKFWQWIKDVCAKIRDLAVNLFRRVQGMFTSYRKTVKRMSDALSKETKYSAKKLADKKVKMLPKGKWIELSGNVAKASSMLESDLATLSSGQIDFNKVISFDAGKYTIIGIKASNDGTISFDDLYSKGDLKDDSLKAHGYDLGFFTKPASAYSLCDVVEKKLPGISKKIEAGAKSLESVAAKKSSVMETTEADKSEREAAKKAIKSLNTGTKVAKQITKLAADLVKMWIKGSYAMYSTRGEDAAA